MSILYLIDPYTVDGDITDVLSGDLGPVNATGSTVVRVPDGVALEDTPQDLVELIDEKYGGLLAFYAGFTDIVADACMDPLTVDLVGPLASTGVLVSEGYVHHCILPGGNLRTVNAGPLGSAPTVVIVVWETYRLNTTDDATTRLTREYVEDDTVLVTCTVDFGGAAPVPAISGVVLNIPVADQGTDLILTFTNNDPDRVYLGSWAVIGTW